MKLTLLALLIAFPTFADSEKPPEINQSGVSFCGEALLYLGIVLGIAAANSAKDDSANKPAVTPCTYWLSGVAGGALVAGTSLIMGPVFLRRDEDPEED